MFAAVVFFFNDPATTEIYTLSLHDALPISQLLDVLDHLGHAGDLRVAPLRALGGDPRRLLEVRRERRLAQLVDPRRRLRRSEEHTSELQSRQYLVCRLLLEKKKKTQTRHYR